MAAPGSLDNSVARADLTVRAIILMMRKIERILIARPWEKGEDNPEVMEVLVHMSLEDIPLAEGCLRDEAGIYAFLDHLVKERPYVSESMPEVSWQKDHNPTFSSTHLMLKVHEKELKFYIGASFWFVRSYSHASEHAAAQQILFKILLSYLRAARLSRIKDIEKTEIRRHETIDEIRQRLEKDAFEGRLKQIEAMIGRSGTPPEAA
jgi:hypothetical protein